MEKQNQLSVKGRRTGNAWSSLSVSEALKEYSVFMGTRTAKASYPMRWIVDEIPIQKPEKELTEKQLFSKLKKELKTAKKLTN